MSELLDFDPFSGECEYQPSSSSLPFAVESRVVLVPRDYQRNANTESFRLWDSGITGVLCRIFTGGGKSPLACMMIREWLTRGPNYHAMVLSYERDLVWQFAQEIYDFLGIDPGIEMGDESLSPGNISRVVVASRPSLLRQDPITAEQVHELSQHEIDGVEWLTKKLAKQTIEAIKEGVAKEVIGERLQDLRERYLDRDSVAWSRLHKFDYRLNWLICLDEAHRYAHSLKSVGHIADWFDRNPQSRRVGMTATPKRGDGISIGHKMFPGVAIDFPLFHVDKPCGVREGWAVPYIQKYIEVEGVDFKSIKKVAGDFDEAELERILGEEGQLAKLVQPLLDMVGERRTLIFSPGVTMAKNVAAFINARSQAECYGCGRKAWYPTNLIGDTAECKCGRMIDPANIKKGGEQARSINGETNPRDRKACYLAHQSGQFQFLSVCALCKEGYNDPDISAIGCFRPVSKKASSLAEQMKGRSCRPCRSIVPVLNNLLTAEERVEAIEQSEKPNAMIVDLVGITGLGDCASTLQIYADGLEDDVVNLAEKIIAEKPEDEDGDLQDAIKTAREQIAAQHEEEERQRKERAAARAKADAEVKYSEHQVGTGSNVDKDLASTGQYNLIAMLGMKIDTSISPRKAGRMINMLRKRMTVEQVAAQNGLQVDQWERVGPTDKQLWKLGTLGVPADWAVTKWDASQVIGANNDPVDFEQRKMAEINGCADADTLSGIGRDIGLAKRVLPADVFNRLAEAGKKKKSSLLRS